MSKQKKYDVEVKVETVYLEEQSSPEKNHYVFAYTMMILNSGAIGAKLLTRHWMISNEAGKTYEVQGEGVLGEQPHLAPGESYEYTSGAVLDTAIGTMQGSYQMIADDGQFFEVEISSFVLAAPKKLH